MADSATAASYKQLKEDFVSNLTGGPVGEIVAVIAVLPVAALLWSVLQAHQSFFKPYTALGFVVDYLLNVGAILLAITLYADSPVLLIILLLAPTLLVYALPPNTSLRRKKPIRPPTAQTTSKNKAIGSAAALGRDLPSTKPFLTYFRGSILVITCLAILAVDFRIFPRRFAKVETWGTSLMDVGVGAFVFSAGLVGARPVLKDRAAHAAGATRATTTTLSRRLAGSLRHTLPLFVLGVVRLLSVKGLDYAEHVTEYGVHWNFFFTLALLPPFVALFQSALRVVPSYAALALLLAVAYQVVLESTGLKAYVLAAPRTGLVSQNREGLASFVGYLAIFLAGQDTGMYVLPRGASRARLLLSLAAWSAAWSALYLLVTDYRYGAGLSVSRRLANLPYVLGVAALGNLHLLALCLVETLCFPGLAMAAAASPPGGDARTAEREIYEAATSRVMRAYNRNGLAMFLVANLLTGLVNMTVPTLDVGPAGSVGILVGYSAVLTGLAVALDAWNVDIKLR